MEIQLPERCVELLILLGAEAPEQISCGVVRLGCAEPLHPLVERVPDPLENRVVDPVQELVGRLVRALVMPIVTWTYSRTATAGTCDPTYRRTWLQAAGLASTVRCPACRAHTEHASLSLLPRGAVRGSILRQTGPI